jgi:hypothetical protein
MQDLGLKVFNFISDDEAYHFQRENPPGPTVRCTFLEFDDVRYRMRNHSFSREAYNRAAEEKRWRDAWCRKMGGEREAGGDGEEKNLDRDACLRVLGLNPGFSGTELKTASFQTQPRSSDLGRNRIAGDQASEHYVPGDLVRPIFDAKRESGILGFCDFLYRFRP